MLLSIISLKTEFNFKITKKYNTNVKKCLFFHINMQIKADSCCWHYQNCLKSNLNQSLELE